MQMQIITILATLGVVHVSLSSAEGQPGQSLLQSFSFPNFADDHHFTRSGMQKLFESALSGVGIVTIKDIPEYAGLHREVLQLAHQCVRTLPPDVARGHIFDDGTQRLTLAMSSKQQDVDPTAGKCPGLPEKITHLRQVVNDVSEVFFERLDRILDLGGMPLLSSKSGLDYENMQDLLHHGDHLDHFHSYHQPAHDHEALENTMDFHTDQGLAIAFTPAMMIDEDAPAETSVSGASAGKFEIQLPSGQRIAVSFPDDHLVFMLGDGVNRYINPSKISGPDLRAVPHAMTMPHHSMQEWRVWFGRMFLPPGDAIQPGSGFTDGHIRTSIRDAWLEDEEDAMEPRLVMGCSGNQHAVELRQLSTDPACSTGARRRCTGSCANNQVQCWWRCMNFTTEKGPEVCAAKNSGFNCTNGRDEISIGGMHHGAYDIKCTNSTQLVRENCELTQINADRPADASAAGFEAFIGNQGSYAGRHNLLLDADNKTEVSFLWNVVDEKVQGMLAYNGKVSWIAIGTENIGGGLRGMKGSHTILGLSSADQEFPGLVGVHEYKIHDEESRFEKWNTPYGSPVTTGTALISQNGYTALKFTTNSIFGKSLNVTSGSNRMIWAIRASSYMHIGKDSYHEGCDGLTRTRYRGGGSTFPWSIDFTNTTLTNIHPEPLTELSESSISGCEKVFASFPMMFAIAIASLHGARAL